MVTRMHEKSPIRRILGYLSMIVAVVAVAMFGTPTVASADNAPNGYPYCANGASSDPDGDGWGWENNASCVVRNGRADSAGTGVASNGYPYCVNGASSDPDGDGWGWEFSASCIVRGSGADSGGSSGGSGGSGGGTASNGYPYCVNGWASDPDGDGWGWENNASCIVRDSAADPDRTGGGGGGGSLTCPPNAQCGSETIAGLGARKQQVLGAGGTVLDLAVAMLETKPMLANYQYGDNKSGDAANFGIFKQNWLMIRSACSQFAGQAESSWNNGAALNSDLTADVNCLHQIMNHYGIDTWFAGHRNGSTGLANPNTSDIAAYKTAVYWIRDRLQEDSANLSNDTRFWVNVPAI